jgi:ring-1,2-phenylacetyl-CoA epoxidase subunit PaaC
VNSHTTYVLHLADNALVLGQRNAQWCGHGPILEEDLAMANNSLDLIGQARLLFQHVAQLRNDGSTEDTLAYFRDQQDFLNFTVVELPHTTALAPSAHSQDDYAITIARNFLYSAYMVLIWDRLQQHSDQTLAAIAEKSIKEVRYHLQHASDWLIRFGDGTQYSHDKAQTALNFLLPYTQEFWSEWSVADSVLGDVQGLRAEWENCIQSVVAQAGLQLPQASGYLTQGKYGIHSEHMSYLLAEMQSLARQHPGAAW